jgi:hypothetical protein
MHPGAWHFLRQRRAQRQGGSTKQDQESKRDKNARTRVQRRPRLGGAGRPARFGMPCMM